MPPQRDEILDKCERGYFFLEKKLAPRPLRSLAPDLATAIEKKKEKDRIYASLPKIDCGCCGAPTCRSFADDIVRGQAKIEDCIHMGGNADGKR